MTKCWGANRKRRVSKGHGKEGRSGSLNSYRTKPYRGHHWEVDRDADGRVIPGTRRCRNCGLPPPGRGKPAGTRVTPLPMKAETKPKRVVKSFRPRRDDE